MLAIKAWYAVLKAAARNMSQDQTTMLGAALAYYTMFSIAPMLIIALGIAGFIFGRGADRQVFDTIQRLIGPNGAAGIRSMVQAASSRPSSGLVATAIGIATLLVGASGVFQQLQQSFNIIWRVASRPSAGWWIFLRQRLLSFAMVAALGFVLLVSLLVSATLAAAGQWASGALSGGHAIWDLIDFLIALTITGTLFSAILKYLPDVQLSWKDVWPGGLLTAVLFVIGKAAIGTYIGKSGVASSYGAAGSLVIILLWVYYSSQILFFGAEFTRARVAFVGRQIEAKEGSMFAMSPLHAASTAEQAVESGERLQDEIPAADLYAAEGSAALAALLLTRGVKRPSRALAGGVAAGISLGILFVLATAGALRKNRRLDSASLTSRLIKRIPTEVKVAAIVGGVRSGGREARREIEEKFKETIR